jgi:Ran GTPase-activating protein (RanGAP) involved in mRNA processing and transport
MQKARKLLKRPVSGRNASAVTSEGRVVVFFRARGIPNLANNSISSTDVGVLLDTMEQNSHHITDLDLRSNLIGNEGASLLARALENNALPNLARLSLCD